MRGIRRLTDSPKIYNELVVELGVVHTNPDVPVCQGIVGLIGSFGTEGKIASKRWAGLCLSSYARNKFEWKN